ncbi:hypothetical protein BC938DRAFT_473750 [Jimgerdemannia flammicorona]|uniref:Uncharacterized protein n=1 Tax=Jimgerdemannia flammicorona TaxID=994334 RepID=A0A433Q3D7_9FUNG|nr:hypothetical protein BC938DRAFT_473750 [Jimgerdemannia flammicorona]
METSPKNFFTPSRQQLRCNYRTRKRMRMLLLVGLDDPAYFTLDRDWTLLGFLTYRQRLDDFQYGNGFEHSRYSSNLATMCKWEEASEAVMKKACQALSVFPVK